MPTQKHADQVTPKVKEEDGQGEEGHDPREDDEPDPTPTPTTTPIQRPDDDPEE